MIQSGGDLHTQKNRPWGGIRIPFGIFSSWLLALAPYGLQVAERSTGQIPHATLHDYYKYYINFIFIKQDEYGGYSVIVIVIACITI